MKIVTFGEVMMRLFPDGYKKITQADCLSFVYGGGEANVSIALASLGRQAAHVTCLPDNALGHAATDYLRRHRLDVSHIHHTESGRLGLYFLEVGAAARPTRVTYDRAGSSFATLVPGSFDWDTILEGATWFHWTGITPAISQGALDELHLALDAAARHKLTVSADINYRKNLWKYGKTVGEVMPGLIAKTDIIFGSKGDIKESINLSPIEEQDKYVPVCQALMAAYPRVVLCLNTKRESFSASNNDISATAFDGKKSYDTKKVTISPIIDRIGGGDAFAAGFIYGYTQRPGDVQYGLECGIASAVLKHTLPGDAGLPSVEEIELLTKGDYSGRLIR